MRARLAEIEETSRTICTGKVVAPVVNTAQGQQFFTLKGADYAYRIQSQPGQGTRICVHLPIK